MNDDLELDIAGARRFHGHSCAGLAIGIRAAEVALREIGRHTDAEPVFAITESSMCAVDAIQYFVGCTVGMGNLIQRDYGKIAFTFLRRSDNKAIRLVMRPDAWGPPNPDREAVKIRVSAGEGSPEDHVLVRQWQEERIERVLTQPLDTLFTVQSVTPALPGDVYSSESLTCSGCGEKVRETRVRLFNGEPYCIPCFEQIE